MLAHDKNRKYRNRSPRKFFESHLSIWAKNDVGVEMVFACCFPCFLPSLLHCKATEHYRLWGTSSSRPNNFAVLRCLPKIGHWSSRISVHPRVWCGWPNSHIEMQRLWMSDAAGYSSRSTIFLLMFSMMSLSASSGIQVCTKLSISSVWILYKNIVRSLTKQGLATGFHRAQSRHATAGTRPLSWCPPWAWYILEHSLHLRLVSRSGVTHDAIPNLHISCKDDL